MAQQDFSLLLSTAPNAVPTEGAFDRAAKFTLGVEGGYVANDAGKGETNFGVNKTANPDVDIKGLTEDGAKAIYKTRYWDKINGDALAKRDPALATIAFDTAINMGPDTASAMVKASGGDPQKLLTLRAEKYRELIAANPKKYGQYAESWQNRLAELSALAPQAEVNRDVYTNTRALVKDRSTSEAVSDVALGAGAGVVQGVGMLAGAFGADNPVARGADAVAQKLTDSQSQYRKDQRTERSYAIKSAEASGSTWNEIVANAGAFAEAPVETTLNALGTSAPTILMGVIPGLGQAGAARLIMQGAMGAAQGAGAAKGSIYEAVMQKLIDQGESPDVAAKVAAGAQAYDSQNGGNIAAAAIIGAVAGTSGVESAAARLAGKKAGEETTRGLVGRAAMGVVKEAPMEGGQGGQERYTSNVALQNEGFDVPAFQGVAGQAAGEALASAPGGAAFGALDRGMPAAPKAPPALQPVIDKAKEGNSPLSKAAVAGNAGVIAQAAAAATTPDGTGIDPTLTAAPAAPVAEQKQLPATDAMGERVRQIESEFRGSGLLDTLREDGVNAAQVFDDLNAARNLNAPLEVRQDALTAVEELLAWAKQNKRPAAPVDTIETPEAVERSVAPAVNNEPPSVDAVVAALRDDQISRLISDSDRENISRLLGDAGNKQLPMRTRQEAAAEAKGIVGRYQTPQGQANGQTTPALETPAATLSGQAAPVEQQFVNQQTGRLQESDFLADAEAPKVAIPAGKDPAFIRKRAAEIKQLVAMGFETVERNGSEFFLINSKTGQRFKLTGMADSQLARKAIADRVNELANTAAASPKNDRAEPTKAQIEAGNYKKSDVIELNGMKIKIENPKDSMRRGTSPDGTQWETKMAHHYGEFEGTLGADGDKLDVFVGPRPDSNKVYVIDQNNADGSFDEHKVMMGFTSEQAAREGYLANYEKGWTGLGAITEMGVDEFKAWAKSRAAKKPAAAVTEKPAEKVAEKHAAPAEKLVKVEDKTDAANDAPPTSFSTYAEAKAYITAQRRSGSGLSALPYPNEDGTFGIAVKGTPGYAKAEKFAAEQNKKAKKTKKPAAKQGEMFTVKDNGQDVELQKVSKEELPTDSSSVAREGERRQLTQNDVSLLQRLASALGKEIQIFSGPVGDGFVRPEEANTIYINEVTSINPVAVFGHELFHKIKDENPKAWAAIAKVVEANIGKEAFDRMMGYGYEQDEVLEEIVSDLGGDFLSDGAFWRDVFGQVEADNGKDAKGIIAKLVAYLNNLVEQLINDIKQPGFNASSLVKDIRAVRAAYKEGITQYLKDTDLTRPALQAQILREENAIKKSEARDQPKVGIHFSKEPRTNLIGSLFGTGLKGAERERLSRADDMRIKRRVSFYVDEGNGITPESGIGGVAHEIKLPKLYDARKNAEGLLKDNDLNGSESRILDAGYDGYWVAGHSNKQGVGVILGDAARSIPAKVIKAPKAVKTESVESTVKKGLVSKEIDAIDMGNIPGATMRAGILSVPVGSREQANAELARIGSVLRFSKDRIETAEEKAKREYAEVEAQYKGTDGWLKAPNGQATELNERQWVQVRTPSFKAWFGDWEKAANGNGVFGDMQGEVSVAVDANGEPLVVYHGTNKGGFTEFKTPGGVNRGDLGIFTTPNLAMAQTYYSKRGGEISLEGTDTLAGLLDAGFDIYDDVDFAELYDPEGNFLGRFDSKAEAEKVLMDEYAGTPVKSQDKSGYYAMFVNMRNPNEVDFEGAMWNGERPGQFIVTKLFEMQYNDDGRAYFDSEEEAKEFADKINGYVEEAPQDGQSTDSVVREARQFGSDGAYIRNVVDSGPGYSAYIDEPSDVFVALDPNQLKSANFNNGAYSTTSDDIRKSVDRSAEEARQYKLDIEREQRAVGKAARLSADEVAAIATDAAKLGLTKAQVKALADDARRIKKQFPESEDWAQIAVAGIQVKLDDDKKPVPGSEKPKFQVIPYGFNVPPGKDRAPAKTDEAWLAKVATKFEDLVLDIYDRAEKGDKNAQIIIGHQTWYRNVAEVLRREYGGAGDLLADLLGATSPNTPVDTNWKFSLDVMRQFMAGKFNDQLAKFSQFLEEGGDASKYPAGDKIRQVSGKLYGMNSVNAMKALVDMWRAIEPGQAPKARNFALNLIGQSNMATIDVWAARMLRRAADLVRGANLPRIPPPAEGGVSGVWNADATKVTGAFGFGAEVMDKVAVALEKRGIKVTPPDLQAIAWFAEKELWGQKGWTTKTGEGGSFEENIEATPVERYVAGWSIQQGERVPSTDKASVAQARVMSMLVGDDSVMAARVLPTSGLYGGAVEASFDTEWTAMKGRHDPSMVIAEIAKIAQENKQLDIFVSKVVGPKEDNANSRPGVEIYFRTARDLEAAKPVLEKFTANGQDGFTMVVDPRVTPKGVAGESFIGVRLQYVPEIAMRFDVALRDSLLKEGAAAAMLEEKRQQLNDITAEVRAMDGVAFAAMQNYDTLVVGKENYSDYIDRIVEGGDQSSGNQAWFGQPLRQGLEGAAARLAGNVGQNRARGVPNASGSVQASRARDQRDGAGRDQSRSLAPLPGAPTVAGATGPDPRLVQVADEYARANGIDLRRQDAYVKVDAERATRIAQAYDAMEHAPQDPKVKEAFENLIKQTTEQYKALEKAGYKFYLYDENNDPYAGNPWNAMRDLRANKVMGVFATEAGFGSGATELNVDDNPLLADTGIKWPWGSVDGKPKRVLANDLFRAVHDAFGHGLEGAGFRAEGEENAWQAHARMFKGSALGALTSETRGQNSWLNYGPYGERNRNAKVEETVFADQKTGLMPSWTWEEGGPGDGPNGGKKSDDIKKSVDRFPDTPEFKRWFKDSKVVNAKGEPLVVYHGTDAKFAEFEGDEIYLAEDQATAEDFGDRVMPLYASIQNPLSFDYGDGAPMTREEAIKAGYDGFEIDGYDVGDEINQNEGKVYVAFRSEQVKSATGNNGEFSDSPDITKSLDRAPWFEDVEKLKLINGYQVGDLFNSSKKLSWWDKSVGTMYNIAEKHPEFKRVFDAVQKFIDEVSVYANRAADKAPNILPKLETWRDIWKKPMSAENVKALSDPIFQGTLSFSRDENGELQPEDDVQKAGVVFSEKELREYFQLNDEQIGLYREFRDAVDQSINDLATADMLRYLGTDGDGVRERVLNAKSVGQAEREIQAHLDLLIEQQPKRAEVLTNTKEVIEKKAEQATNLMARGYAPLSRYGQYTVYVVSKTGEQEYFGMFETQKEANKMAREMEEQYPDSEVQKGTMSQESYKLFSGVTPETLALFGESMGLEENGVDERSVAYQQYLKLAKSNRSAMKRLIQRKGIDGFSEDAGRVLAGFVYSNARQISTNLHAGEISKSVMDVKDGDVKDAAIKLMQYIQNPQEEAQALRGLMFAQFIGGSVASALVNMTQPFTMTMPYLSQFAGVTGAAKRMSDAVKLVSKGITGDDDLAAALKRAEDDGVVSPQEVHQLMAQSQGKGALQSGDGTRSGDALAKANNSLAKLSLGWGKLFGAAEQFNRRVTFIAAYKVAREQGMANPFEFAENAIRETQGVYNKGNKPQWARGAVGATLFTFKQYSIAYVEFLQRMWGNGPEGKKAVGLALAVLFLMSGLGGMPGADDLDDVIDGIAQRVFNKSFDSKQAKKEFFVDLLGRDAAEFVMGGITSIPGSPIDLSGRMGLGNLIPGTGVFTKKTSYTRDVMEIAGPAGSMVSNWATAAGQIAQGEFAKAGKTVSPVAAQNLIKATDMATMGQYRDEKGRKVIDVNGWEALAKGMGFQPSSVKQVQEATATQQNLIGQNKIRETEIADLWTAGRVERDQSKIDRAKEQLADWNRSNPASPIKIDPAQINKRVQQANMNKAQRIAATAPKEIRGSVKKELESVNQ